MKIFRVIGDAFLRVYKLIDIFTICKPTIESKKFLDNNESIPF